MRFEVLVEGVSDEPVVREVLARRFQLREGENFNIHPHQGKGRIPANPNARPAPERRGLLDQLPAKLRGWHWLDAQVCVVVLVDADSDDCTELLAQLHRMLAALPRRPPRVMFRLAIEEVESWFIADHAALARAYPRAKSAQLAKLRKLRPDAVVGAWERLAEAVGSVDARGRPLAAKLEWATRISPHLNLHTPASPSLQKFMQGVARELSVKGAT